MVTGTLLSVIRFPMSSRYIQKLRRFLQLKDTGEENAALKKQLETVVTGNYRQPYLSGFLIFIFRLFYRHKLVNADHIRPDERDDTLKFFSVPSSLPLKPRNVQSPSGSTGNSLVYNDNAVSSAARLTDTAG